jgi:dihydroxyacid dehydratase/phosphogluconate dehydratase
MGTASTMTSIVDAMGLTLPGASSIPAADSGHPRMASACGERMVAMIFEDLKPSRILDARSFRNGLVAYMALGGSTNAAVHLIAMARRVGVPLTLDDMARVAGEVPVCANLFPSGEYLMEDFYFAGGLLALLRKLEPHLEREAMTVNGRMLGENIAGAECWNDDVIRDPSNPVVPLSRGKTLAVLRGNLAPNGAVMKSSAASPNFLRHVGPALVFDSPAEMNRAIDDPDLEVTEDSVIVLRNAGPVGAPGMPEWGNLPIPKKLLKEGVRDMVRICDGRMSGTHYGTCILHVTPEAAVGGPLALLRTGDIVELDVPAGRLDMRVDDAELKRRQASWKPTAPVYGRSFAALYQRHVTQADEGCDFDFLSAPGPVAEPAIF